MAINDVSLTAGMRSNLLSLQNTVSLLDRTQNRLSSGKKVNTAMDNPVSFFAAQALNSRASVIDSLKDAMGQAVQTITAADKGITAISAMIEQAKGLAQSALSADTTAAADQTITFATVGAVGDTFTIAGKTFTAIANDATPANDYEFALGTTTAGSATALATAADAAGVAFGVGTASAAAGVVTVEFDKSTEMISIANQYDTLLTQLDELAEDAGYKGKNLLSGDTLTVKFEGTNLDVVGFNANTAGLNIEAVADAPWAAESDIDDSITSLDAALTTLRSESSKLSGNLSIISVRQDFSTNMINTLTAGADKLTLADANEEGANMLMLQTRQSLSTTALSLSAQAAQSVLRLFQ